MKDYYSPPLPYPSYYAAIYSLESTEVSCKQALKFYDVCVVNWHKDWSISE